MPAPNTCTRCGRSLEGRSKYYAGNLPQVIAQASSGGQPYCTPCSQYLQQSNAPAPQASGVPTTYQGGRLSW